MVSLALSRQQPGVSALAKARGLWPTGSAASAPEIDGSEKLQAFFKRKLILLLVEIWQTTSEGIISNKILLSYFGGNREGWGVLWGGCLCRGAGEDGAACSGACRHTAKTIPRLCRGDGRLLLLGRDRVCLSLLPNSSEESCSSYMGSPDFFPVVKQRTSCILEV